MKNSILLLPIAIMALAIIGCDDDEDPVSPPSATSTGTVTGLVYLLHTNEYASSHAGVTVRIEGTSHVASSDSTGRWFMHGVPAGVHTFKLSKPGYTHDFLVRQQFVGRDTLFVWPRSFPNGGNFLLQRYLSPQHIDSFAVTAHAAAGASPAILRIDGVLTSQFRGHMVTIFFGPSSSVSEDHTTYRLAWQGYTGQLGRIAVEIDAAQLHRAGFAPGSTVHAVAYPGGASRDYDWVRDRYYYKDIVDAPTPVVSVVVP